MRWKPPKYKSYLVAYARRHRRDGTVPERVFWSRVRRSALGVRFVRQRMIGDYIVDFLAPEIGLVVEIDGRSHIGKAAADAKRQAEIEALGFEVIRFANDDVLREPVEVFATLGQVVARRAEDRGLELDFRERRRRK